MIAVLASEPTATIAIPCLTPFTPIQLVVSVRRRDQNRVAAGDPWDGRSLEWSAADEARSWLLNTTKTISPINGMTSRGSIARCRMMHDDDNETVVALA